MLYHLERKRNRFSAFVLFLREYLYCKCLHTESTLYIFAFRKHYCSRLLQKLSFIREQFRCRKSKCDIIDMIKSYNVKSINLNNKICHSVFFLEMYQIKNNSFVVFSSLKFADIFAQTQ